MHVIFELIQRAQSKIEAIEVQHFSGKKSPIWHIESQRDGVQPSNFKLGSNHRVSTPPQTYTEVHAFLSLGWTTAGGSLRGLHALHSH